MNKAKRLVPLFLVLISNVIGFGILFFSKSEIDTRVLYYSAAVLGVVLISYSIILFMSLGDDYLFLIVSMIFTIGIVELLRLTPNVALDQIKYFYLGMAGFYVVLFAYRSFRFWHKPILIIVYLGFAFLLFTATLLFGEASGGSKNWLNLGLFSIQPSEIIKISFVLALAALYSAPYNEDYDGNSFMRMFNSQTGRQLIIMVAAYMHIGFMVLQREWGSALLYFLIYFVMQYVFGKKWWVLGANAVIAVLGGLAGVRFMTHIQQRIAIWLDPFVDPGDLSHQIVQSLYAMASGGVAGSGIGQGSPWNVPEIKNDFIFAAICEEMGMIGGTAVIFLFFMLVYRGIKIALRVTNPFNKAVALGLSAMFAFQSFIIIGGVTNFIPMTGITLPFMSAGGSSLAACFAALAILQAISSNTEEISDVI